MWPLPTRERDRLADATLLSCALIGSHPWHLNTRLMYERFGIGDVSAHVIHGHGRQLLYEEWVEVRPDGAGRWHTSRPPGAETWPTIRVDHLATPARDRLAALVATFDDPAEPDRAAPEGLAFARNATAVAAPGAPAPLRTQLRAFAESGRLAAAVSANPGSVQKLAARLLGDLRAARDAGAVDGVAAADVLIGIELASAIAKSVGPADGPFRWAQYAMVACRQIGAARPSIGPVLAKAVREGFAPVIDELAGRMLARGEKEQRRALDLERPNRIRFAKILYDGYPYLLAARQLARSLTDLIAEPGPAAIRTFQVADERAVRSVDGMIDQWADLDERRLRAERAMIARAQAAGDRMAVRRIIVQGEEALRRPRSARPYLLGETIPKARSSGAG